MSVEPRVETLSADELDTATLHGILRLRCQVFVVEQSCAYLDIDGRDLMATTQHLIVRDETDVLACLRILAEPDSADTDGITDDTARIGRVCTAPSVRGRGLSAALMERALELTAGRTAVLDAQTYLVGFYQRFGFEVSGAGFLDDGIPHTPMRRRQPGPEALPKCLHT